jgi:hypothetical protein
MTATKIYKTRAPFLILLFDGGSVMSEKKIEKVMGPVDYIVILFPGNKFSGKIAPELEKLQLNGIIRIIDLVFILKDKNGRAIFTEARNLGGKEGEAFKSFTTNLGEWLSEDDIEDIGELIPKNSAAAALLFENTWAVNFKKSLLDADAKLITQARIPGEQVEKVMKERIKVGGT